MKLDIQLFAGEDGYIVIGTKIETKEFDAQLRDLENKIKEQENDVQLLIKFDAPQEEIDKSNAKLEQLKNQYVSLKERAKSLNEVSQKSFNGMGKSITGVIKKVGRWAFALVGIRSIYGLLSSAAAQLQKTNEQTYQNLQYLKFALASALEPVITWLVNMATKLLITFGSIIKTLTGINIFANATANAFKKADKSANGLKKTLAGFDEITKVSVDGSTNITPSIDIAKAIEENQFDIDEIYEKIKKYFLSKDWYEIGKIIGNKILDFFNDKSGFLSSALKTINYLIGAILGAIISLIVGFVASIVEKIVQNFENNVDKFTKEGDSLGIALIKAFFKGIIDMFNGIDKWIEKNIVTPFINGLTDALGLNSKDGKAQKIGNKFIENFIKGFKDGIQQTKIYQAISTFINYVDQALGLNTKEDVGTKKGKTFGSKFINGIITAIKNSHPAIQIAIDSINSLLSGIKGTSIKIDVDTKLAKKALYSFFDGMGSTLFNFMFPQLSFATTLKKFKYAKGGVINLPGKGIPIGGEAGREGVVPLTDSQQMELLGEEIGKWITINLTNNTNLDGQIIARQINKINQANSFITNG